MFCVTARIFQDILEHSQTSPCSVTSILSPFSFVSCPGSSVLLHTFLLYTFCTYFFNFFLLSSKFFLTDYATFSCQLLPYYVFRKRGPQEQWVHFHFEPGISVSQHLLKVSKHRNHSWFFHCCPKPQIYTNEKCTDFFKQCEYLYRISHCFIL